MQMLLQKKNSPVNKANSYYVEINSSFNQVSKPEHERKEYVPETISQHTSVASKSVILSKADLIDSVKLVELLCPETKLKGAFYAVHRGRKPGIYKTWPECEAQIKDINNASYRKFDYEVEAQEYVLTGGIVKATKREIREIKYNNHVVKKLKRNHNTEVDYILLNPNKPVVIFTDGASSQNGKMIARAGIGVYWGPNHPLNTSKRLPGRQTNNRAEIHAAVHALYQAKEIGARKVKLYTDSQFVIHSITDWIKKWKENGWKLVDGKNVVNKVDFIELEAVSQGLDVKWVYVKAHARNHGNDEADKLAVAGSKLLLEPANCSKYFNINKNKIINETDVEPFLLTDVSGSTDEISSLIIPDEQLKIKSYYAVYRGKTPGVYTTWVDCQAQIRGYTKPVFRKFSYEDDARLFVRSGKMPNRVPKVPEQRPNDFISVFTHGATSNMDKINASAGIGVYWGPRNEFNTSMRLSGHQTNDRAEIHAAIYALKQAKYLGIKNLRLHTDSQYVINVIFSGIDSWKKNNWISACGKSVYNKEGFMALDRAREELNVDWCYAKVNNPGEIEADKLAVAGCSKSLTDSIILG